MSVSYIGGFKAVPEFDAAKISQLFKSIREVSGSLDVEFDANVHDNVEALFITSLSAGDKIRTGLVSLQAVLMASSLNSTYRVRLEKALARDTEEKRQSAAAIVWQFIGQEVNETRAMMEHLADSLTEAALGMEQLNLNARPTRLIERLNAETLRDRERVAVKQQNYARLVADGQLLDATITALDKVQWSDLSVLLPTAEQVASVIADPSMGEAVMIGIARIEKLIGVAAGGIKYVDAIRLRDEIRTAGDRDRDEIRRLTAVLSEYTRRKDCLEAVLALHERKQALQHELLRVPKVLEHYNLALMLGLEAADLPALIKRVDECSMFVDAARRQLR